MVSSIDLSSTGPVQATANLQQTETLGNPRVDNDLRLDQIQVGKTFAAQILDLLHDGTALVKLNISPQQSANLQIQLPEGYQLGDTLYLSLQSLTYGRPRFLLQTASTNQDQVNISHTALLLEKTLVNHPETPHLQGSQPVSMQANTPPQKLANELSQTVENSGLFYESHLKDWTDGQRSLEQIRQEPQNLSNGPQAAMNLLPAQLDTLENQRFIWQGEIWPGQSMDWEIHPDDKHSQPSQSASSEEKRWSTTLKLDLPKLGIVKAEIHLQGDQLGVQINSRQADTALNLRQALSQLAEQLSSDGTRMTRLVVEQNDGL